MLEGRSVERISPPSTLTFNLDVPKFNHLVSCGQCYDRRSLVTIWLELAPCSAESHKEGKKRGDEWLKNDGVSWASHHCKFTEVIRFWTITDKCRNFVLLLFMTKMPEWRKWQMSKMTCPSVKPRLTRWLRSTHSGRTSVCDRRTFPVLRSTCSWWVNTYVGNPSAKRSSN